MLSMRQHWGGGEDSQLSKETLPLKVGTFGIFGTGMMTRTVLRDLLRSHGASAC